MIKSREVKGMIDLRFSGGKLIPVYVKTGMFVEIKKIPIEAEATKRGKAVKITLREGKFWLRTIPEKSKKTYDVVEVLKEARGGKKRLGDLVDEKGKRWRRMGIFMRLKKVWIKSKGGEKHVKRK